MRPRGRVHRGALIRLPSASLVAIAFVASCGSTRSSALVDNYGGRELADADVAPAPLDWVAVAEMEPGDAVAIWRSLGARGDNLAATLARIESEGAVAMEVMAAAVLDGDAQEGEPPCEQVVDPEDPYLSHETYVPELKPSDDYDSPCLRRALQLWALRVLPASVLQGDQRDTMLFIASVSDEELIRAAYARVTDEALMLAMLAALAGDDAELADELALKLSDAGRATAAIELGIDGALLGLDASVATDVYLTAVAIGELRDETRVTSIARLTAVAAAADRKDGVRRRIVDALAALRVDDGCVVAATAIDAHASLTGSGFPLDLPPTASPKAYLALICRASTSRLDATALWRKLIPTRGVTIEIYDALRVDRLWQQTDGRIPDDNDDGAPDIPEADPDGDGDPYTQVVTVRVPKRGRFVMPEADRLPGVLLSCWELECLDQGGVTASFEFTDAPHGRLQLVRIRWRFAEEVGD